MTGWLQKFAVFAYKWLSIYFVVALFHSWAGVWALPGGLSAAGAFSEAASAYISSVFYDMIGGLSEFHRRVLIDEQKQQNGVVSHI